MSLGMPVTSDTRISSKWITLFLLLVVAILIGFSLHYEFLSVGQRLGPCPFSFRGIGHLTNDSFDHLGELSKAFNPDCNVCDRKEKGKFHLITTFFPVTHPTWRSALGTEWSANIGDEKMKTKYLEERVTELLDVLQKNLNNNLILAVHILFDHPYIMFYLMGARLKDKQKLVFHHVTGTPSYRHAVEYIQTYLLDQAVIFTNQDIYMGQGLEKVNTDSLRDKKIAYTLSRRGTKERYCVMPDPCGPGQPYIGSHDTYIFVQTFKYTEEQLKELDFKMDVFGAENIFIHFLVNQGHFRVLNPCYVLYSYHVHCRYTHSKYRPRINTNGRSGGAAFSNSLE